MDVPEDLENLTVSELRIIAGRNHLWLTNSMRKADIIRAITYDDEKRQRLTQLRPVDLGDEDQTPVCAPRSRVHV